MALPTAIAENFHRQADGSAELGSPFTALVCRLLADRLALDSAFALRMAGWRGNPRDDALAVRAVGGLHSLARSQRRPGLTAAYPPNVADHEAIWTAIQRAIHDEDGFLSAYLDHPPQTNEVARSSVLLGGCLSIAETTKLPLELIEIGSSAGLNLTFDRYRYDLGVGAWGRDDAPVRIASRWRGLPAPLSTPLMVSGRSGCDVTPLDPGSPADRARLLSYIWPDQFERLARAEAALAAASRSEVRVDKADAGDWLASRLNEADPSGRTRVVFHTIVWQYLPAATKERIKTIIHDAGGRAATDGPLAWLSMEPDAVDGSAAVRVTIWPGGKTTRLGRADYHGRWSAWGRD